MKPKALKSLTLNIRGKDWTFLLLSDKVYDKLHNTDLPEGEGFNSAMTLPSKLEAHFRMTDLSPIDIRHEIGHILYDSCLVGSSSLTPYQVEETFCEIIGQHTPEIILWTDRVLVCFMGE